MAYLPTEKVAKIRKAIRKEFPKSMKFSVTTENYSGVNITLMQGPAVFAPKHGSSSLNKYSNNYEPAVKEYIDKVQEIVYREAGECVNHNANDPTADYPDLDYYIWMNVGKWNKPYKVV